MLTIYELYVSPVVKKTGRGVRKAAEGTVGHFQRNKNVYGRGVGKGLTGTGKIIRYTGQQVQKAGTKLHRKSSSSK